MLHTDGNGKTFWKKFVSTENTGNDKVPHINFSYSFPAPSNLTSRTYNLGNNTGYIDLNWNSVPGAIKYRVWIFDGKEYKPYDVGNRTSWSTKDKSIWPNAGMNLPEDPRPYYQSSGGTTYNDRRNYAVTVSAIMSTGEESLLASPITMYIPLMDPPTNLNWLAYSNGDGTGYVNLNWDFVSNASGYKVWIFDGINYVPFDVGNVSSWSTENQFLWPTTLGKPINTNKLGSELLLNPSPFYAGTRYEGYENYWFRVTAYNSQGETIHSNTVTPNIPKLNRGSLSNTSKAYNVENNYAYVELNWEIDPNSSGYKVWMFNGQKFQWFDVGNTTSWSSLNYKVWPKQELIDSGVSSLIVNGTGEDLPLNPSLLYYNSGAVNEFEDYKFKVSLYNSGGESIPSEVLSLTIPDYAEEDYTPESGFIDDYIESDINPFEIETINDYEISEIEEFIYNTSEEPTIDIQMLEENENHSLQYVWILPALVPVVKVIVVNGIKKKVVQQTLKSSKKFINVRNGDLANKTHPVSKVKFDANGFPKFDSKFTLTLSNSYLKSTNPTQFAQANKLLLKEINKRGSKVRQKFTSNQLSDIRNGNVPRGYVWHHHQTRGVMQLVDKVKHQQTLGILVVKQFGVHYNGSKEKNYEWMIRYDRKYKLLVK